MGAVRAATPPDVLLGPKESAASPPRAGGRPVRPLKTPGTTNLRLVGVNEFQENDAKDSAFHRVFSGEPAPVFDDLDSEHRFGIGAGVDIAPEQFAVAARLCRSTGIISGYLTYRGRDDPR